MISAPDLFMRVSGEKSEKIVTCVMRVFPRLAPVSTVPRVLIALFHGFLCSQGSQVTWKPLKTLEFQKSDFKALKVLVGIDFGLESPCFFIEEDREVLML